MNYSKIVVIAYNKAFSYRKSIGVGDDITSATRVFFGIVGAL